MFSNETESHIWKLFFKLADEDNLVEELRRSLGDQLEFNPFAVFRFLDSENKNFIDEYNLLSFLK